MKIGVTYRREEKVVRYERALREVGLDPVRLPPDTSADRDSLDIDSLDGLMLTGGTDINPTHYGQTRDPRAEDPDDARDDMELRIVKQALAADLPIFAICRGMQLFNVAHGGTLIQHLPSSDLHSQQMPDAELGRHGSTHAVKLAANSRLREIIGENEIEVNSRHHQAADRPGDGLVVSAVSNDGVIEAVERPDRTFAVAVQWHPEDRILVSAADRKLFEAFARAASLHRANVLQHR